MKFIEYHDKMIDYHEKIIEHHDKMIDYHEKIIEHHDKMINNRKIRNLSLKKS